MIKVVTPRTRNVKKRADEQQYTLKIWEPLRNDSVNKVYSKKGQMLCKSYKDIDNNFSFSGPLPSHDDTNKANEIMTCRPNKKLFNGGIFLNNLPNRSVSQLHLF